MSGSRATSPLMAALFALVLGLFVAGPLVDALACGQEIPSAAEAALVSDDHSGADTSHGQGVLHGCAHGHCHAASGVPPIAADAAPPVATSSSAPLPGDLILISAPPEGLIRPPRA